ncbi:MAG TPA: polysaccharide biosynthesis tyrosine autokinase [Candidatus Polarisedimenticolia bacterium]|jgi:capsular exopolysaccharide synthesis family protein|nr:polysaccharide biosynthesis tyrosine autokinase [Candidatus Polarisedimenticolia bacterium]
MSENAASREINLMEYWTVLVQRRWVVFTAVLVLVITVTLGSFLIAPTYMATCTIQIEREQPNVLQFQQVQPVGYDYLSYNDFYQTQYRLLSSRNVARKAMQKLDLRNDPVVNRVVARSKGKGLMQRLSSFVRKSPLEGLPEDPDKPYIEFTLGGLDINPLKNTHLVEISFISVDPELASRVANAVATSYIEFNQSARYDTTAQASEFIATQTDEMKKQISDLEAKLNEYGEAKQIIGLDEKENIVNQKLGQLNQDVLEAQVETSRKEARYRELETTSPESIPEVTQSNLIQQLRQKTAELEREYTQKSKQFKADWPDMQRLKAEWDNAREGMATESRKIYDNTLKTAKMEYNQAAAHERTVRGALEGQKSDSIKQKQYAVEYANLKAAVDSKREILNRLMQRESETGSLSRLKNVAGTGNIWVVDSAEIPDSIFRPNKKLNILLSLVVGLGLGVGMAFFLEYLDNSIKSTADVEKFVQLPVLGAIPMVVSASGPGELAASRRVKREPVSPAVDLVTMRDPTSSASEAYKTLRTSLLLSTADSPPRIIVITSSEPQEGKTVTTLNTAITLTQSGKRVLLVDGDMRRPRLHKALGAGNFAGLSSYLSGNADLGEIVQETEIPNLFLVASGPIPPNPSELLASEHFDFLLGTLRKSSQFDHVLIDSPPLLSVADPVIMAAKAGAVILVVQCGRTAKPAAIRGREKLQQAKANILGVVLNDMDVHAGDYYSYRYRYRHYRYETDSEGREAAGTTPPPVA